MQKIILFDVDGVLIRGPRWDTHIQRDLGIPPALLQDFFSQDFEACLEGFTDLKKVIQPWLRRWGYVDTVETFLDYWFQNDAKLCPQIMALVHEVYTKLPCYLATNQEFYRKNYLMRMLGFEKYFRDIFSACDFGAAKPKTDFFRTLLVRLRAYHPHINANDILFIDDSPRNIEAALRHNIDAHHYTHFGRLEAWLREKINWSG